MQISLSFAGVDLERGFYRFQPCGSRSIGPGFVRDRDMAVLYRGFPDLKEAAEHLEPRFVPSRGLDPGQNIPLPVFEAVQGHGWFFEENAFGDDLLP